MLTECNAAMDWLREIMKADDSRVARSQVRTYAIMAEMDAMRAEDERRWKKP